MTDLNLLYGTVTDDSTAWGFNTPARANDGDPASYTYAGWDYNAGATQYIRLKTDLGSARRVAASTVFQNRVIPGAQLANLQWSDDGATWHDSGVTPTDLILGLGVGTIRTWALAVPVTARWWRVEVAVPNGFVNGYDVNTWALTEGAPPLSGVYADWDGDGFGEFDNDNITSHMASWRITRGASAEITGGAQPGTCTLILNNPSDDRFNPLNTSGPLYGKLRDGVNIWVSVNADGELRGTSIRGLFGGRITDITPILESGADIAPTVEIQAVDCLGWYKRVPVQLAHSTSRTQGDLRAALLTAGGETRVSLPSENASLALSSADGRLLEYLDALNASNGSRHYCQPGNDPADWYTYVAVNRQHGLSGVASASLDDASVGGAGRGITGSDGWRLSADTVINQQKVSVTPVVFTLGAVVVWEAGNVPFSVQSGTPRVLWMEFDDVVTDPTVNMNYTGTAPSTSLEAFGATARLTITSTGTTSVSRVQVEGRLARRAEAQSHVSDDVASQAPPRGVRAGSEITGDTVGVLANARGLAQHITWRYGSPQFRPTVTVEDWSPMQFEVQLYDVVSVTVAQVAMAGRLFEVVGIAHEKPENAPIHTSTLILQECRVQSPKGWFTLDSSLLDGPDVLAY